MNLYVRIITTEDFAKSADFLPLQVAARLGLSSSFRMITFESYWKMPKTMDVRFEFEGVEVSVEDICQKIGTDGKGPDWWNSNEVIFAMINGDSVTLDDTSWIHLELLEA